MKITSKKINLIFLLSFTFLALNSFTQNVENVLILSKKTNQKKIKQIDPNSYYKVKNIDGKKLKGKFANVSDNYFISTKNDTIFLNEIYWIKAKQKLTKGKKAIAITAVFAGTFFSFGTIPAALMFAMTYSNYWVILAPIATISASVFGIRTLGGRRYKMNKWKLKTKNIINANQLIPCQIAF